MSQDEGNIAIGRALQGTEPFLATRMGSGELQCAAFHRRWRSGIPNVPYMQKTRDSMRMWSGFFPVDDASLDRFADLYERCLSESDLVGLWFYHGELQAIKRLSL